MNKCLLLSPAITLLLISSGCQSTANFPDKSAAIQDLTQQKTQLIADQEDILVPSQYQDFSESLAKADTLNSQHKDASKEVAEAQKSLRIIHEKSIPTRAVLGEVLTARHKAMEAGALKTENFQKTDKDLASATDDAAAGNIKAIEEKRTQFQNRYTNSEGDAIVFRTMGSDQKQLADLKSSKDTAPKTYQRTESKLFEAERSIRSNRYNTNTLAAAQALSATEIARLAKISSDAQRLKSEPAAIEIYEKELADNAAKQKMQRQNNALANQNSRLQSDLKTAEMDQSKTDAELSASTTALNNAQDTAARKQAFDEKFATAKKTFDPNEAEVFQDGDNLLIRLKGLSFVSGKGTLPTDSAALLKKLGTVVADFGTPKVRIEGHTDSVGTVAVNARLSKERAGIVKDYLVSQRIVRDDDVVAQGLGEAGPVATNKTAAGRAQNRRVDVIVQP